MLVPPRIPWVSAATRRCFTLSTLMRIVLSHVMRLLLEAGARADILLTGITWGKDMEWETECFDVTPVSYAQLGLLRQFQRSEEDTYSNIRTLLEFLGRKVPPLKNIPNRYLYK